MKPELIIVRLSDARAVASTSSYRGAVVYGPYLFIDGVRVDGAVASRRTFNTLLVIADRDVNGRSIQDVPAKN